MRLSEMQAHGQRVKCVVSPYHTPALNGPAAVNVRAMYGLAKETWNHADWNRFYQRILCYSHYSQQALARFGSAKVVGNPRFDARITARSTALCRKISNQITVNLRCSTPPRLVH